ncbi:MAG TPA: hypothetical protein VFQ76_05285, partial [Longimicrobiaceae bacterium]|nr:hypothetical protein [Longimicrobiaceae bacterium]
CARGAHLLREGTAAAAPAAGAGVRCGRSLAELGSLADACGLLIAAGGVEADAFGVLQEMIALRAGRSAQADGYLATALEYTRRSGDRLTEAETLEEVSVLQARRGDSVAAESAMSRAAEIYRSYGAHARIRRMQERMAET